MMADKSATPPSTLQKPPGYRDPNNAAFPRPLPPKKLEKQLPPAFRKAGKPISSAGRSSRSRSRNSKSICCRLCIFLIIVIISILFLIGLAGAIGYLYFQPHIPYFRFQTPQQHYFNVTTKSDGSGTFLDADLVVNIVASNQKNGKIWVSYSESSAVVYVEDEDGDIEMGSGWMGRFEQGTRNATVMRYEVKAKGVMVDDVVGRRVKGRFQRRELKVGVEVRVRVAATATATATAGSSRWRTCPVPVRLDCSPVSFKAGGALLPNCDIYLFRWINLH